MHGVSKLYYAGRNTLTLSSRITKWILKTQKKLWDSKWNLYQTSSTKYKSLSSKGVNSEKPPQTKCMIWQKSCMTLRMLFVCLFWGSLVFMKQLLGIRGLTMLHFLWPRAWLFLSLEMLIPNLQTIKKINFYPYLRTMQLWSNTKCCLQFQNSFPEKEFFSALQPELWHW